MKKNEVPQDEGITNGITREVQYALDQDGKYVKTFSKGWEPKNIVNQIAWDVIEERTEKARQKVEKGKASPVLYFMEKNQMDYSILAGYMNISRLKVWWHCKARPFRKLSKERMDAYAEVFDINSEELINFNPKKANDDKL